MYLNTIQNAPGSHKKKRRLGRGIGSTKGKTCGKGHKGQKSRSGGYNKRGFEGGQMPIHMRLPKIGFNSRQKLCSAEIRLHELSSLTASVIDLLELKKAKLISGYVTKVKVFLSGSIDKAINLQGIAVTKGAKAAIEAAGGKVE